MELSINEWCATQPHRQDSYEVKGWVLLFPRTNLIMVPFQRTNSGWNCIVVRGDNTYPVGGYDLSVSDNEIECAIRLHPQQREE